MSGAAGSPLAALWTFPSILASAFVIAWAAEAAQEVISRNLALALLAWVQTLPEFGVEAVIAWRAGAAPQGAALAVANLTGAIRLLIGFGWPLIVAVVWLTDRGRTPVRFERRHAAPVLALVAPLCYFGLIVAKGTFTALDAAVLVTLYAVYLARVAREPPGRQTRGAAPAWARPGWWRVARIVILGAVGTGLLVFTAHPFFTSMLAVAAALGLGPFLVVQWIAPVLTELPEMVSTVGWARRGGLAPMALGNLVSSNLNQWTVLAATIPVVYGFSHWRHFGTWSAFDLDAGQRAELLLTLLQTGVGVTLLLGGRLGVPEGGALLLLWGAEVAVPAWRPAVGGVYAGWLLVRGALFAWRRLKRGAGGPSARATARK